MQRFESFIIFAEMRTGSNFLEANLNAMEGLTCYGEVYNPYFIGKPDTPDIMGVTLADRVQNPSHLWEKLKANTDGLAGFRFFHDHDLRILPEIFADAACAKIVLTRNPIESYVSWKIAQATGQWKLTDAKFLKSAQVDFDGMEFERHVESLQSFQISLQNELQRLGQVAFYLDYEDINDLEVLNGLARYLGVPPLARLDEGLKKQNPAPITDKLRNPDAVSASIARLDRFNLSRTPNFEPRRMAAVPQFQASRGAGLLHMPLRSGPDARVAAWLESSFGALESGFTQKTLRQWKRKHPKHRSFSVLRHPVARAHDVFCRRILSGAMPEIRQQLAQAYQLPLPPGLIDYASHDMHRDGFKAFLRWLKLNLGGQTGLRVDAHWASQAAVLQGYANFQTPDMVLREDRLEEGLSYLCDELGLEPSELPPDLSHGFTPLREVYDAEIEDLASAAYQRDYVMFGFEEWRG